MKRIKAAALSLIFLLLFLTSSLFAQIPDTLELEVDANAPTIILPKINNLTLQEKCSEQAQSTYQYENSSGDSLGYVHNYDKELGVCFIETFEANADMSGVFLMDANTHRDYADYIYIYKPAKGIKNLQCSLDEQTENFRECNSITEFNNYVKLYIEN